MKVSLTFLIITETRLQILEILENTEQCEENKNHIYSDPAEIVTIRFWKHFPDFFLCTYIYTHIYSICLLYIHIYI